MIFINLPNAFGLTRPWGSLRLKQKLLIKEEIKMFLGVGRGQFLRLTTLPPSVSLLSRLCAIPYISQHYGLPRHVTEIALIFYMWMMFILQRKRTYMPPLPDMRTALYTYIRTTQKTHT
jgi:hypothetical protein